MPRPLDVVNIGNAIVDVLTHVDTNFLAEQRLEKGTFALVDEKTSATLLNQIKSPKFCAGGASANSMAGIASLGGTGAFIGRVHNDKMGQVFIESVRESGLEFITAPTQSGPKTAQCISLVTPDADRTMRTYLGASIDIHENDIEEELISRSEILFLETYLMEPEEAYKANLKAARLAKKAGKKVAVALSDVWCVQKYYDRLFPFVKEYVDIIIANEREAQTLLGSTDLDDTIKRITELADIAVITRGPKGSIIVNKDTAHTFNAPNVKTVVDTTGAGDLYAGGFLFAFARGYDINTCGQIASLCAAEVISHLGARPQERLEEKVQGLL